MTSIIRICVLFVLFVAAGSPADDADDILVLLNDFLAHSDQRQAHERFWADDLVYTSSAGTRTDKASILASFDESTESATDEPGPTYTAEEVELMDFGSTAVVAFKLVATPPDDLPRMYYLNTGTFVKRDGEWRVVAWQATKVPPTGE
jgi:hypothetical protein